MEGGTLTFVRLTCIIFIALNMDYFYDSESLLAFFGSRRTRADAGLACSRNVHVVFSPFVGRAKILLHISVNTPQYSNKVTAKLKVIGASEGLQTAVQSLKLFDTEHTHLPLCPS